MANGELYLNHILRLLKSYIYLLVFFICISDDPMNWMLIRDYFHFRWRNWSFSRFTDFFKHIEPKIRGGRKRAQFCGQSVSMHSFSLNSLPYQVYTCSPILFCFTYGFENCVIYDFILVTNKEIEPSIMKHGGCS